MVDRMVSEKGIFLFLEKWLIWSVWIHGFSDMELTQSKRISLIRFEDLLIKGPPIIKFSGTPELL
jgi:hypothetical protein